MLPGINQGIKYPERKPFFAHWYTKKLGQLCYANQIGADGCWMLSQIAMTEDSRRYKSPPTFYNGQLMSIAGCASENTMVATRKKCLQADLLHYEPGVKRHAGVYWVKVPIFWPAIPDNPLGEFLADAEISPQNLRGNQVGNQVGKWVGNQVENLRPSYPNPVPNPTPTKDTVAVEKVIEKQLLSLGVAKARETIHETLLNGTTLATMTQVIDYFASRPGAWGPGALRRRLTLGSAQSLNPDQGWPPASSRETQTRRAEAVSRDRERQAAEAQSSTDRKLREHQLELRFGPILDALPADEIHRIVTDRKPNLMPAIQRYGLGSKVIRLSLLGLMATAAEPSK